MKYVYGNWKMNNTLSDVQNFKKQFKKIKEKNIEFGISVPFLFLQEIQGIKNCKIGAQNVSFEKKGAFTGEISAKMLAEFKVDFCLIGHSERRQMGETDKEINEKLKRLNEENIMPVLCVGESLEEYESKRTKQVLKKQLFGALKNVQLKDIIIAYEPVWAIGTGQTPTMAEVVKIVQYIKDLVSKYFNKEVKVLYGGSVNLQNSKEFLSEKIVDGALIGGASLSAENFINIGKRINE